MQESQNDSRLEDALFHASSWPRLFCYTTASTILERRSSTLISTCSLLHSRRVTPMVLGQFKKLRAILIANPPVISERSQWHTTYIWLVERAQVSRWEVSSYTSSHIYVLTLNDVYENRADTMLCVSCTSTVCKAMRRARHTRQVFESEKEGILMVAR